MSLSKLFACSTALALAAACSNGGSAVSLSARVGAATAATRAPQQGSLTLANGIVVSRIRLVVRRIKLKGVKAVTDGGRDGGSHGDEDGDSRELKTGPFLVDLAGAALEGGTVQKIFDAEVPAGTYRKIEFEIHKLSDSEAAADARFADLKGTSVVVDGKIDGKDFTFTSALNEEQEREGPFTVGAKATSNVTLSLDPTKWFTGATARLDPNGTDAEKAQIEQNIKASLDAFEDDDHDGRHDDGDHHNDGGR